jgi:nicotinamidase-related amidase
MKSALILIDIQNDYFEGGKCELVEPFKALKNAEYILRMFREANLPVIHVQHINTREGATFFLPDSEGVKIHEALKPQDEEYLIIKHRPNSFYKTDLNKILASHDIKDVVICGMMTHMCIDTTVRAAKDYDLNVTVIEDACTTKDLRLYNMVMPAQTVHNTFMAALNGMFANIVCASKFKLD